MTAERRTVPTLLHHHVLTRPDTPFVVTEEAALTFAALDDASRELAARLVEAGVAKGTRVGLLMHNGIEWAVAAFAVMRIGAVLVPLSTLLRPPELEAHLRVAGVETLIVVSTVRGRSLPAEVAEIHPDLRPAATPRRVAVLPRLRSVLPWDDLAPHGALALGDASIRRTPAHAMVESFQEGVRPGDDLAVIFTSGSRGVPKGVIHTQAGALGATRSGLWARCVEPSDRLYLPMPMFWMGGFGGGLVTAFVAGCTLVTEAEPHPERTLRLLEREAVTLFRGWPDQAAQLATHPAFADADLSQLKPGSLDAVLAPERRGRPGARPVLFGMTETFGPYCGDRLDRDLPDAKHGSLGRPFDGIEVAIRDPDTGHPVPAGEVGEIHVRGPNVMRGICGRTREETFTADGFYPTGDMGRLDHDGYLWFAGRSDDMFKVRGASVFPSEVEAALEALPPIRRAFVVDIGFDGAHRVGAAVVLEPGATCTADDLAHDARQRLSAFKVPAAWALVGADDIPRTPTGKVDKGALRRLVEGAP